MLYDPSELIALLEVYCRNQGVQLGRKLGHGVQGLVYSTDRITAIKIHGRQKGYVRERNAYLRLREHNVRQVRGLRVPVLQHADDERKVLEMTLLSPPFILDFGGAYIDNPPQHEFTESAEQAREELEAEFGDDWSEVQAVLAELRSYGIFVVDVNARNIQLPSR